MAVLKTYLGAVNPVGEKIVLNYVRTTTTVVDDDFDFILDENYYVTGVTLTKTVADLQNAVNTLSALVMRVPVSGTPVAPTDVIAQAMLASTTAGFYGQTATAGVPTPIAGLPVSLILVPIAAPAVTGATVASYLDPTIAVQANSSVAGTSTSRQRIRLKVLSVLGGFAFNPSCLIVIELAKYASGITQGATGNSNQLGEVSIPAMV